MCFLNRSVQRKFGHAQGVLDLENPWNGEVARVLRTSTVSFTPEFDIR